MAFVLTGRAAENLALGKPYRLSPEPDYALCKDAGDATQLTDGVFAKGPQIWCDKATVGWRGEYQPAVVTVDLGRVEPISGFSWSCAAGVAGVHWPAYVNVFTSVDGKEWTLVGDLLGKSFRRTGTPPDDSLSAYRAWADDMPAVGRYVTFLTWERKFKFVDEVEVYRGPEELLKHPPVGIKVPDPLKHYAFLSFIRPAMLDADKMFVRSGTLLSGEALGEFRQELEARRTACGRVDDESWRERSALVPLTRAHARLLALNARLLRASGFREPTFWTNCRWENLDMLAVPGVAACDPSARLEVEMMRGETRATSVNVLNPTERDLSCRILVEGFPATANVRCREVLFSMEKAGSCVGGALRPSAGRTTDFLLPAGCSKQVWISFEKPSGTAGTFRGNVRATCGGQTLVRPLTLKLHDLDFPERPRLHIGGWDYLEGGAGFYHAPKARDANIAMMRELFVDTPFAHATVMPKGAKFGPNGSLLNPSELDFSQWDAWVALRPDARLYAVFVNGGETFCGEPIATPRFNRMVSEYFDAWAAGVEKRGVDPRRVVLHLFDEVRARRHDEIQIAWAKAVRAGSSKFVIFSDPYHKNPSNGLPETYSVCDILCPQVAHLEKTEQTQFFVDLKERQQKTLWLYSCSGPSRTLDPISYYRAQEWLAWQIGAKGSCFWAFGCGGGIGDSWHAWRQPGREYSPYFVSPTDTMASKQSEGIREGVEDYELLAMLNEAIGTAKRSGHDVSYAEALLQDAPAYALCQDGRSNCALTVAVSREWNVEKPRARMDEMRIKVLRALSELVRIH